MDAGELRRGSTVGRYLVLDPLHAGARGSLYAAYDHELARKVALRVFAADGADAERLLSAGRAVARLAHPNVVSVFDLGRFDGGAFVAMELVQGSSLADWLSASSRSWRDIVGVFTQAGDGLAAAAAAGLWHGGFDPAHVLIDVEGRVRLIDLQLIGPAATADLDQPSFARALASALAPAGNDVPSRIRAACTRERFGSWQALLAALAPARRRRRAWGTAAVIAVAAALVVLSQLRHGDVCGGADDELRGIWDPPRRLELAAAFGAVGKPYASAALAEVSRTLDSYTRGWVAMKTDSCRATAVRHVQSEERQGVRDVCLAQRLADLQALIELMAHADAEMVARAPQAVGQLTAVDSCAEVIAERDEDAVGRQTAVRGVLVAQQIAVAGALGLAGKPTPSLTLARRAADNARALGDHRLAAIALQQAAAAAFHTDELATAKALTDDGIDEAVLAHDDPLIARLWVLHVSIAYQDERNDEALAIARHAGAAIERGGGDPTERARLDATRGSVLMAARRYPEALAAATAAYQARTRIFAADDLVIASSLEDLGEIYARLDRFDESARAYERVLAIRERKLGPDHPDLGTAYVDLGDAQSNRGDRPGAAAAYRHAQRIFETSLGPDSREVGGALASIASVLDDEDESERLLIRAIAIFERFHDLSHGQSAHLVLAHVYLDRGELERASRELDRAQAIAGQPGGPDLDSGYWTTRAQLSLQQRHLDLAEEAIHHALALDERIHGEGHSVVATEHALLGQVYALRGELDRAIAEYQIALEILGNALGPDNPVLAMPLANIGLAHAAAHRYEASLPYLRRALALREREVGTDSPSLMPELAALGDSLEHTAKRDEAITVLDRALAMKDAATASEAYYTAELALARALWSTNRDRARASRLATDARDGFAKLGAADARSEAARWLAEHR